MARRRRLVDCVHGLAGTILARSRQALRGRAPEGGHRALLADDHLRVPARSGVRERVASVSGRDEVRADVTERVEPAAGVRGRAEAAEPATRDVLEKETLD